MKCAKLMLRRNSNMLTLSKSLRRKVPSELSLVGYNLSDTKHRRVLPYQIIRLHSSSSSESNESQADNKDAEGHDKWRFTWRHDAELLPRIQMENARIHSDWRVGLTLDAYSSFTAYLLQVPLWNLATRTWQQDLADHTGWAFVRSIACLLSNVYKVPLEDVINKEDAESESLSVEFQYTTPDTMSDATMKSDSVSNSEKGTTENESSKTSSSTTTKSSSNERPQVDFCEEVRDMLQEKLYYLFKNNHAHCHVGKGNEHGRHLELTLHMKPVRATLRSLQCFPGLSRPAVEEKADRWEDYISMIQLARAEGLQAFLPKLMEFNDEMLEQRGKWETTAIAEVVVECVETFSVRDIHSNTTIQGLSPLNSSNSTGSGGRPQNVIHLIRLEKNFSLLQDRDNNSYYQESGNWCITDIDDLLDGNKWHRNMV